MKPNTDDGTVEAEDELRDAEIDREAMDEALKESAVPWERVKKDQELAKEQTGRRGRR